MWNAHLTRDPAIIPPVARIVVRADWIFTGTSGLIQPLSGVALAHLAGWPLASPWLLVTYALYAIAFGCWVPVVRLQIRARDLAEQALRQGTGLGLDYHRTMVWWFILGWPAFLSLFAVFWLMIAKPQF
jgi:uncharacterized membrane protein